MSQQIFKNSRSFKYVLMKFEQAKFAKVHNLAQNV
jgi:hypothetical protein